MDKYGILIAIVIGVIAIIIKLIIDERSYKRKLIKKIKQQWGDFPLQEYTHEKMEAIRYYHNHNTTPFDVDAITWNDLDMDEIFTLINHTESSIGEEYLYDLLHKPVRVSSDLDIRNEMASYFEDGMHEDERIALQYALHRMGKVKNFSVYEYLTRLMDVKPTNRLFHILCACDIPVSIGVCFIHPPIGFFLLLVCFCFNTVQYYSKKKCMEKYYSLISYMLGVLEGIRFITKTPCKVIQKKTMQLTELSHVFDRFKRGYFIVISGKTNGSMAGGGSPIDFLLDYIRMLFHVDLIKFNTMICEMLKHEAELNEIFSIVGQLDSVLAIASYRELFKGECTIPTFETGAITVSMREVYHPMISDAVKNSINEQQSVLITGSNASGKSTFIKTIAINAILAQTIDTAMASSYHCSIFQIYSSMALKDNLFSQESYYMVEIKSLKRIMDARTNEVPILCFIDEVLRGTNTLERIASSSQILSQLARENAICFAATHDIELTHILEQQYSNYHFQEEVTDNDIQFDYKLYKGRAMSRNAIRLLQLIGYDAEITRKAEEMADGFLKTGIWTNITEVE